MKLAKPSQNFFFSSVKFFLLWVVLFLPRIAAAQTDKEFWFVAPYVFDAGRSFNKPILLRVTTSATPATVKISMPANASFTPITRNVASNSTVSVDLTAWISDIENTPANAVLNRGLLITSTADITAYYEVESSYCNCNPEIFSLKGKNALGTEFFVSSQNTFDESQFYTGATSAFDVVATKNNTHVNITPRNNIVGHAANVPFTVVLNAGQTFSAAATNTTASGHLQGSYITSDSPIAVTIKDDLVQVSSCADLIGDQTVPTTVLGSEYIVTKGYLQSNDYIYVTAVADGTSVYVDGSTTPAAVLAKGASTALTLSNNSAYIHASDKIYVYHFTGNGCEAGSAIIPKINCTGSQSVSIVRSNIDLFAVTLTTKNGNQGNFRVNGNSTYIQAGNFSAVPGTGGAYVTAKIDLSSVAGVGTALNFTNTTGYFSLGAFNGGVNDGTLYGFFSNFKASNVQSSLVELCPASPAQLSAFGGVSYKWSPATGLSDPNIANPIASPTVTTDYTVLITTAEGCVDSAKVRAKVLVARTLDTSVAICQGGSYKLPSGRVVNTAGTYTDVANYKSGCDSLITTLHLTVDSAVPTISIAASENNICAGTTVTFTATPANQGASPFFQWQVNGVNTGANSNTFTASNLNNSDKIKCLMTGSNACGVPVDVTSNEITMTVNPRVMPSVSIATPQNTICAGTIVTFTATVNNGGVSPVYQWRLNGNNTGTNSASFTSNSLANNDNITCVVTSNAICATPVSATSNTLVMTVNPNLTPSVSIAASATTTCPGETLTFTATTINAGIAPVYQWRVNGIDVGTNSSLFSSTALKNGDMVTCTIVTTNTCLTSNTTTSNVITVNVAPGVSPTASIIASDNNICAGTAVTFTAFTTNGGNTPVYQWQLNGSDVGTRSDAYVNSNLNNNDVVSCKVTSNAFCAAPLTVTSNNIIMTVNPMPVANAGSDRTIKKDNSVILNATATGNVTDVTWSPTTGLDNFKILTPTASPIKTTVYTLTVQSSTGCISTDEVKVTVLSEISIPNTFTPNGDGVNDKWEIKNLSDYPNCLVQVFNRWGLEVFSSRGYAIPWDGTMGGKLLPFGTYYYVINLNNNTQPLGGNITIIR